MINFIIGIFTGAFLGVTTMTLLSMAKDTEPPKQEKHEPAKLWTKGNLCRWHRDVYEIYDFGTYDNHQTYAFISDERWSAKVPIEELEEVEK